MHLLKGEQRSVEYLRLNPAGLVPSLVDDDANVISQSLAIIEYLDEIHPANPLLPKTALDRAHVRALSLAIACEVHPLNNARVLGYLTKEFAATEAQKSAWIAHWISLGLGAFETTLEQSGRSVKFCFGDTPTMADCVLVPQMFSARRFGVDVSAYPLIAAIDARCNEMTEFQVAHPAKQSDFQA